MNGQLKTSELKLEPANNSRLANLCGQTNEHLRLLERHLGVEINNRGNSFRIIGDKAAVEAARRVLQRLYDDAEHQELSPEQVQLTIKESAANKAAKMPETQVAIKRFHNGGIRARGEAQRRYINHVSHYDINFGIGPAGTGKTYLAVACAVEALETERVQRIVLVRPAVEAGERLGFLPGDMAQKIDPYLRPLYDALYEMLGFERVMKLIEKNIIEIAPLAYMRGRTLNDAFIILDEAQNATIEQMKMFLTRTGFGSTVVVTGDITQVDLPRNQVSGLRQIVDVLKDIDGVSFTFFQSSDVVRHPLVQRIVEAYAEFDKKSGAAVNGSADINPSPGNDDH